MVKYYKIHWNWCISSLWFFDKYREWFVIVMKEFNYSRLVDFKQALKTRALQALKGL